MQFYELEACIAIADSLNFARACDVVNLSPSALSRLVSRVEEELGVKLFHRDTRSVSITQEGKLFIEFARKTLEDYDNLMDKFSKDDDELRGTLRIFASVTACYTILSPLVELLNDNCPKLKLTVETGDPADASLAIKEGRADLAVDALGDASFPEGDFFQVYKSPLVFVASNYSSNGTYLNHLLTENKYSSREIGENSIFDLISQKPMILSKSGLSRANFDKWCKNASCVPEIYAECGGHEGVLALTGLGLGIGLVPQIVLENSPFKTNLTSVSVGSSLGYYEIGFVLQKEGKMNEKLRNKLIEMIHSLC